MLSKGSSESEIQNQILVYLWALGFPAFHVPNHGKYDPATNRYNRVSRDHIPGIPDIVVPTHKGSTVYLEVKRQGKTLTDNQEKFHNVLRKNGHLVGVVHSLEEAKRCLIEWRIVA